MNRSLIATAALIATLTAFPAVSFAEDSPLAFNASLTTEYRYRGISQSRFKPALQGGLDFTHSSGVYFGAWASSIKWIKDAGGDASVEIDVYGGYKGEVSKDVGYDVGVLTYIYPSNKLSPSANTTEVYAALTFGPVTAKYSHSTTNLFGFAKSKSSGYFDINATLDLGDGWSVVPHLGRQNVQHNGKASYTDFSVVVGKDVAKGVNASLGVYGTDADKTAYVSPSGKFLGRSALVGAVKFTF